MNEAMKDILDQKKAIKIDLLRASRQLNTCIDLELIELKNNVYNPGRGKWFSFKVFDCKMIKELLCEELKRIEQEQKSL